LRPKARPFPLRPFFFSATGTTRHPKPAMEVTRTKHTKSARSAMLGDFYSQCTTAPPFDGSCAADMMQNSGGGSVLVTCFGISTYNTFPPAPDLSLNLLDWRVARSDADASVVPASCLGPEMAQQRSFFLPTISQQQQPTSDSRHRRVALGPGPGSSEAGSTVNGAISHLTLCRQAVL
jgi:hypothetical protein